MGYWKSKHGVIGDQPADAVGDCIDKIQFFYRGDRDREPTLEEIRDTFDFVMRPLENREKDDKEEARIETEPSR